MNKRTMMVLAAMMAGWSLTAASDQTDRAAWMRGSCGVSVHWTAGSDCADGDNISFAEAVNGFDAKAFADRLHQLGARHLIFTTAHAYQYLPMPNAALDRIAPGRTSKRDLFGEILDECHARGIRVIAYYNHSCNGTEPKVCEWMKACKCPCQGLPGDYRAFCANITAIVRDIALRYGKKLDGWWFDSPYSVDHHGPVVACRGEWTFPWAEFLRAARAGNPQAAVAVNPGVGYHYLYTQEVDYHAGEAVSADEPFTPAPTKVDTRWLCVDDTAWVFSARNGFCPLRFTPEELRANVLRQMQAGRMLTYNVLIDKRGKLSPHLDPLKDAFAEPSPAKEAAFAFDASSGKLPATVEVMGKVTFRENGCAGRTVAGFGPMRAGGQPHSESGALRLKRPVAMRTGFVVARHFIPREGAFLIGSSDHYELHAGCGTLLERRWASETAKHGHWCVDGALVDPLDTVDKAEFHLIDCRLPEAISVDLVAADRQFRIGGVEIAEVLLYDRELTECEYLATRLYLLRKWRRQGRGDEGRGMRDEKEKETCCEN